MIHIVETTRDDTHSMGLVRYDRARDEYPLVHHAAGIFTIAREFRDEATSGDSLRDAVRYAAQLRDANKDTHGPYPIVRVREKGGEVIWISQRIRFRND